MESASRIWKTIPAADYERHMGHPDVLQTQALSAIFGEVYADVRPRSLAVLGCTTGSDFAHLKPELTERATGVDVNATFLSIAGERFSAAPFALNLVCGDVLTADFGRDFDLIHAALLFEYVDPAALIAVMVARLAPGGACSVVIQQHATDDSPSVSPTGITSLTRLGDVIRLCDRRDIEMCFKECGFVMHGSHQVPLLAGKSFWTAVFTRQEP